MSICTTVISIGIHNIVYSVMPDVEQSRIIHITLIRVMPNTLQTLHYVHTKYGYHT
jgi:hypothetical protein